MSTTTTMNIIRPTTVISVRGRKPAELLADPGFVYVGRAMPRQGWQKSIFGNPFRVQDVGPLTATLFREWLSVALRGDWAAFEARPRLRPYQPNFAAMVRRLPELRGKALGCWCGAWKPGEPDIGCHAVVLAKLANSLSVGTEGQEHQ